MRKRYGSFGWLLGVGLLLAACSQQGQIDPDAADLVLIPAPVTAPLDPGDADTIQAGNTVTIEQLASEGGSCIIAGIMGQSFTATATGKLVSVALAPISNVGPISNVTLSVRAANRVTVLHSQNIASFADAGGSLVTYPLTAPVQVVSGQVYGFDVSGLPCEAGLGAGLFRTISDVYSGGFIYGSGGDGYSDRDAKFRVVIDPEPDTVITANPPAFSNSTSASFRFNGVTDPASSAVTSFECKLGSGSFVPCTPPQTYSGLSEGSHTFQVRSVDGNGDKDATPAIYTWSIDTTAPTASPSLSGTAGTNGWYTSDVTVNWNWADDAGGSGLDTVNCTNSSISSGEGGAVVVSATCKDLAGNTGSASVTLKIDKTKPTLSPTVVPNPVLRYLSATATPNALDTGGSGVASSSCPAVPTSSLGNFSVTCTATDRAGNTATASAAYTVVSSSQALSNLRSQVQGLSGLGFVNRTLLLATLSQAQVFLSNGVRSGAVSSLNTFISQVDGIRGISGGLTNAQANALIAQANLIIQSINAGG